LRITRAPQVHKLPPASEYERANRPYAPLSANEKLPTMAENWTCVASWRRASMLAVPAAALRARSRRAALRALTRRCD
jgi:hypothetical protein